LKETEDMLIEEEIKEVFKKIFKFVTGHPKYEDALNPFDRRMIHDNEIAEDDEKGIFY